MLLHGGCPYLGHGARPFRTDFALALHAVYSAQRSWPNDGEIRSERHAIFKSRSFMTIPHSIEQLERRTSSYVSGVSDFHQERGYGLDEPQHTLPYIKYLLEHVSASSICLAHCSLETIVVAKFYSTQASSILFIRHNGCQDQQNLSTQDQTIGFPDRFRC